MKKWKVDDGLLTTTVEADEYMIHASGTLLFQNKVPGQRGMVLVRAFSQHAWREMREVCKCPEGMRFHANNCPTNPNEER